MDVLKLIQDQGVAQITLNRPPANALAQEVINGLNELFNQLEKDDTVKAIIIYGEGRFFSAGADIKEFTAVSTPEEISDLSKKGQELLNKMEAFPKPIIAAIKGAALGGGLELSMACHMRIIARGAQLGLPELKLGIIPGFAGTQRLPRLVGVAKATEMILTGEAIDAEDALRWGLANQVVAPEDLLEKAWLIALACAEKSRLTVTYALKCIAHAEKQPTEEGERMERDSFAKVFLSHDGVEGVRAFVEKRKPNFQDR